MQCDDRRGSTAVLRCCEHAPRKDMHRSYNYQAAQLIRRQAVATACCASSMQENACEDCRERRIRFDGLEAAGQIRSPTVEWNGLVLELDGSDEFLGKCLSPALRAEMHMHVIWRSLFMLSQRCTQRLCSTVRGIGLSRHVRLVNHGDLRVGNASPSWQTRFSACHRIGMISAL